MVGGDHGSPPPKGGRGGGGKGKAGGLSGGSRGKAVEPPPGGDGREVRDEDSSRLDEQGSKFLKIKQKKKEKLEDSKNALEDSLKMVEDLKNTVGGSSKMAVDPKKVIFEYSPKFVGMEVDPNSMHGGGPKRTGGAQEVDFPGNVQSLLARFGGAPKLAQHTNQGGTLAAMEVEDGVTDGESISSPSDSDEDTEMEEEGEIPAAAMMAPEGLATCTQGGCSIAPTVQDGALKQPQSSTPSVMNNSVNRVSLAAKGAVMGRDNAWKKPAYEQFESVEPFNTVVGEDGAIEMDSAATAENHRKLERALVGKLFGRKFPFHFLNSELHKRWAHWGEFQLILAGEDCFICIFETMEARDNILRGGPWFVAGQLIGMDKWSPEFSPKSLKGFSSPIWIRLLNLPLLYWDKKNIGRIASGIGEPLWMDSYTGSWGRSEYARVCVRVDFSKKLPSGVKIKGEGGVFFQQVAYEGISQICFHCGMVGHRNSACSISGGKPKQVPSMAPDQPSTSTTLKHIEKPDLGKNPINNPLEGNMGVASPPTEECKQEYGSWVVVTRRKNTKNKQGSGGGKSFDRGAAKNQVRHPNHQNNSANLQVQPKPKETEVPKEELANRMQASTRHSQELGGNMQFNTREDELRKIVTPSGADISSMSKPKLPEIMMEAGQRTHSSTVLAIMASTPTFKARSDGSSKRRKTSSTKSKERANKNKNSKDHVSQALLGEELEALISRTTPHGGRHNNAGKDSNGGDASPMVN